MEYYKISKNDLLQIKEIIITYRDFELNFYKENNLLYFSIYDKNYHEWVCSSENYNKNILEKINDLKKWVDEFYKNIENNICSDCYEELDNNLYCKYCDLNYNKYIK